LHRPTPVVAGDGTLVHDAEVSVEPGRVRPVTQLYSDDPSSEHTLTDGQILTAVSVGPAVAGERAAYWRANQRLLAEWPLVEAVCRMSVVDGTVTSAAVAIGGVAPAPMRLTEVELALVGEPAVQTVLESAASRSTVGVAPAPQATYKVGLIEGTVLEVLERAVAGEAHAEVSVHERAL
jgi:xanthine dehydrogenase YagS FAD-binding subunit